MNILFGFAGRLGRLEYFLMTLLLAVFVTLLVFLMVGALGPRLVSGGAEPPSGMILAIVAVVGPIFLWFTLTLQAKRFRDMGWNPLLAICAWIGLSVVDKAVAFLIPALSSSSGSGTLAGAILNLAMVGCLLFWPSQPASEPSAYTLSLDNAPGGAGRGGRGGRSMDWGSSASTSGFGRRSL